MELPECTADRLYVSKVSVNSTDDRFAPYNGMRVYFAMEGNMTLAVEQPAGIAIVNKKKGPALKYDDIQDNPSTFTWAEGISPADFGIGGKKHGSRYQWNHKKALRQYWNAHEPHTTPPSSSLTTVQRTTAPPGAPAQTTLPASHSSSDSRHEAWNRLMQGGIAFRREVVLDLLKWQINELEGRDINISAAEAAYVLEHRANNMEAADECLPASLRDKICEDMKAKGQPIMGPEEEESNGDFIKPQWQIEMVQGFASLRGTQRGLPKL